MRLVRTVSPALITALLAASCSSTDGGSMAPPLAGDELLSTTATIRHLNLEGGCWVIETASGRRYEPVDLAPGFRTDGMAVQVVLRDAPGAASVCQVGPLVLVDSIAAR